MIASKIFCLPPELSYSKTNGKIPGNYSGELVQLFIRVPTDSDQPVRS